MEIKPFTVTYKGLSHTCTDPACHVIGFVATLVDKDTEQALFNHAQLSLVKNEEDE